MDRATFESLLQEVESTALDFKRDQYPFDGADRDQKSEIIKDILGFVNCWRQCEAFILIGVSEKHGAADEVVGIEKHLEDPALQQLVNAHLNHPIEFAYEAFEFDGKKIGVIRIPQQERPVYLTKDCGKLKREAVYVRRGTCTDVSKPATPGEIVKMGLSIAQIESTSIAFDVRLADPLHNQILSEPVRLKSEFTNMASQSEIASLVDPPHQFQFGNIVKEIRLPRALDDQTNSDFYREYVNYHKFRKLFAPVRIAIRNCSEVAAVDVLVELEADDTVRHNFAENYDEPEEPKRSRSFFKHDMSKIRPIREWQGKVELERRGNLTKVEISCGTIQPGRTIWSDQFYIAVRDTATFDLMGLVFATNRKEPEPFAVPICGEMVEVELTLEQLYSLADAHEETDD